MRAEIGAGVVDGAEATGPALVGAGEGTEGVRSAEPERRAAAALHPHGHINECLDLSLSPPHASTPSLPSQRGRSVFTLTLAWSRPCRSLKDAGSPIASLIPAATEAAKDSPSSAALDKGFGGDRQLAEARARAKERHRPRYHVPCYHFPRHHPLALFSTPASVFAFVFANFALALGGDWDAAGRG